MKKWVNFIYSKLRYDSLQQTLINILKTVGVSIYPYYIYEEHFDRTFPKFNLAGSVKDIEIRIAKEDDMYQILDFPDRLDKIERLNARLKRGDICMAAWLKGKIIAFSWANLQCFEFHSDKYRLLEDEAYLYDAYTTSEYRGRKLAYILRDHLYTVLKSKNKVRFYSFSIKTNVSAVKFKKNINATIIDSGLRIIFFKKWYFHKKSIFEKSHQLINT